MNYTEIKNLALAYSDRADADVANNIDSFIYIVESHINRKLRTSEMSVRATIETIEDQQYYGLPDLFGGIRDIEIIKPGSTKGTTAVYVNPEQMNNINSDNSTAGAYYTIVANQIQIFPTGAGDTLEIIYYKRLDTLSAQNITNWISDRHPDLYVFGLMVEIESFVKNAQGADLWNARFLSTLDGIDLEDRIDRWSGTPLTIKQG